MKTLKEAARAYATEHADRDGLAFTPVPGLRIMCVCEPRAPMHSVYRPLVCLVLQGAKHMTVGLEERVVSAGQTVLVGADMPVVGRILQATEDEPYLAVAVEFEIASLRELAATMGSARPQRPGGMRTLFVEDSEAAVLDCAMRLLRLVDRPEASPLLRPGILKELQYWLLSGQHGPSLRALVAPDGYESRLGQAIDLLRADYRGRIPVERLASAAAMSPTAFHKHFKNLTSLTPHQYQQRLRLLEARRLMLDGGCSATSAAFEVGYESASQFTREYRRLFSVPPKQDAMKIRRNQGSAKGTLLAAAGGGRSFARV
jgi:AraC-like DNA-binding protein